MISDALAAFSVNQSNMTTGGANAPSFTISQDHVDLSQNRDIGEGQNLYVRFRVRTSFVAGNGTPRLYTAVTAADNTTFTTNATTLAIVGGTGLTVVTGGAFPGGMLAASLTAGQTWYLPIPPMSPGVSGLGVPAFAQRYLGVVYWQFAYVGNTFSSGSIDADLVTVPRTAMISGYPGNTD